MKIILTFGACILLCCPVYSQQNADLTDLLIACYELMYSSEVAEEVEVVETTEAVAAFTCMKTPDNFYDNFHDFRIGFDLLQIRTVTSFSFSDSVAVPLRIPLKLSSEYGILRDNGRYHQGIDFELSVGDTVYSVFCGEVRIETFDNDGYGNVVVVRNYNMSETLYGHLEKSLVKNGQKVSVGQPVGIGGNTGISTGPHLHFEIRSLGYSFNPIVEGLFLKKYKIIR